MAERGVKKIWVDTMVMSGTGYKWGIVNLSNSNTVITPSAVATVPYGVLLDDAATGEAVPVLRVGRAYGYDADGDLNNGDYVSGKDSGTKYHKLEKAIIGTTSGIFGRVVGDDATAADDLVLVDYNFIAPFAQ